MMDITPIYELRSRLKAAAVAGTNLLTEDFRLKRAVEAIQPLAGASPVFAKIAQMAGSLVDSQCQDVPGTLLDTITLVDAVLCTQAAVTAEGELIPLESGSWGNAVTNAPYSLLKPLLDALSGSGGGRYSYVLDMHKNHPELFSDYRVKEAMVGALGASYAELAYQAAQWLKEEGEEILPLLMKGFDPKGKKEMVRRVQVIEAIAGAKANGFYLEQLQEAEKEVRQALIYALRHSTENLDLLMDLVGTEKGNVKKMVYWALAGMEGSKAAAFWKEYIQEKPAEAVSYLIGSGTEWASELVAQGLEELLLPWTGPGSNRQSLTVEQAQLIGVYLRAVPGKSGEAVCQCCRLAAKVQNRLDIPIEGTKADWEIALPEYNDFVKLSFQETVPFIIYRALLMHPDAEWEALAVELYEQQEKNGKGEEYFPAALAARLLSDTECVSWARKQLERKVLLLKQHRYRREPYLVEGLQYLVWSEERNSYILRFSMTSQADGQQRAFVHEVAAETVEEMAEWIMHCGSTGLDEILGRWIRPGDEEQCRRLGEYFRKRCICVADSRMYLPLLKKCGETDAPGLAVHYCRAKGSIQMWELFAYLQEMPGSNEAKAQEARQIYEMLKKGEIKGKNINLERLEEQIARFEN